MKNVENFDYGPEMVDEIDRFEHNTGLAVVGYAWYGKNENGLPDYRFNVKSLPNENDINIVNWIDPELVDIFSNVKEVRFFENRCIIEYHSFPEPDDVIDCAVMYNAQNTGYELLITTISMPGKTLFLKLNKKG